MDHAFVCKIEPEISGFNRIYVADKIGNAHIRRGKLFPIAIAAVYPFNRRIVALFCDQLPGISRQRLKRIVVDITSRNDRDVFIKQADHLPRHTRFCLPAQTKE